MPLDATICLRENPKVTKVEHTNKTYSCDSFYPLPLELEGNACVVDGNGDALVILLANVVPERLLQQLETVSHKYKALAQQYCTVDDIRGPHVSVMFGSYVEAGGSGSIWTRKHYPWCYQFLEDIKEIGEFVDAIYGQFCIEHAVHMLEVPDSIKLWKYLSLLFWNSTSGSKQHLDVRDFTYSIVLPFGNFHGSYVHLYYLNTYVKAKRGDIYIINSNRVYHSVVNGDPDRQSLTCTNHKCVVQHFCNIDTTNVFLKYWK